MKFGEKNVVKAPLVPRDKIIFHSLHIKLGLMKQFVKALVKGGQCLKYICKAFPGLSSEKLKQDVFGSKAWNSFVAIVNNFMGIISHITTRS